MLGPEHSETLATAGNLATSLSLQGKHADAEKINRELLKVQTRVLGAENPNTLTTAGDLSHSLSCQGKHAEAEAINLVLLRVIRRVLGADHPDTLRTSNNLAASLSSQAKHAEAEVIQHELLAMQKRVLGMENPVTLLTANNLATSLFYQGKHAEAEQMLKTVIASCQRVLGPAHQDTLETALSLHNMQEHIRAYPTNAAAASVARLLPAGTRVLVQRLVAKPEHNGKCARVLSFDPKQYTVTLDDGKELPLNPKCVVPACAAAGCTSEEARSVCGRCQAVRYCSHECQRADWKAHKPACAAIAAPC